jgi:hypothetical protein
MTASATPFAVNMLDMGEFYPSLCLYSVIPPHG